MDMRTLEPYWQDMKHEKQMTQQATTDNYIEDRVEQMRGNSECVQDALSLMASEEWDQFTDNVIDLLIGKQEPKIVINRLDNLVTKQLELFARNELTNSLRG